jgi:hypothetical protein
VPGQNRFRRPRWALSTVPLLWLSEPDRGSLPAPVLVSPPIPVIPWETTAVQTVGVEACAAAIEGNRSCISEVERQSELERTTIKGKSSGSGTQVVIGAHIEHATVDARAAGVSVDPGERQRSGAELGQRVSCPQCG